RRTAEDDRVSGGLDQFGVAAGVDQPIAHELGRAPHVAAVCRVGADTRHSQQLDQLVNVAGLMLVQVGVNCVHAILDQIGSGDAEPSAPNCTVRLLGSAPV